MVAPLVIRRALGTARDAERVAAALRAAGEPAGDQLSAALREDRWGIVLVAERAGVLCGTLVLRFLCAVGAGPGDAPVRALCDGLFADEPEVREALTAAACAEAEARALSWREGAAPPVVTPAVAPMPARPHRLLEIAPGVPLRFTPEADHAPMVTRWSGATAFRARRRADLGAPGWSVEGCVGADDDDGDALRFDGDDRSLREVFLRRPARCVVDDELLARLRLVDAAPGALHLPREVGAFSLPRTAVALFDVSLDVLAALTAAPGEGALFAVAVTDALALLFEGERYVGWRVTDPVSQLRPMGWPEVHEGGALTQRDALAALVHDYMVIDASPRPRPDEVTDPDDIAHMVSLRERARSLAAQGDPDDRRPGVARDIGAHVHWAWGFFRVGDG